MRWVRSARQRRVEEQLSAYIDGELSAVECERLEARLEADANLRAQLAALRRTVGLVRELPAVEIPQSFLMPQAAERRKPARHEARRYRTWLAPLLTTASTIATLLFAIALAANLVSTGQLGQHGPRSDALASPDAQAVAGDEAAPRTEPETLGAVEGEAPSREEALEGQAEAPAERAAQEEAAAAQSEEPESLPSGVEEEQEAPEAPSLGITLEEAEKAATQLPETQASETAARERKAEPSLDDGNAAALSTPADRTGAEPPAAGGGQEEEENAQRIEGPAEEVTRPSSTARPPDGDAQPFAEAPAAEPAETPEPAAPVPGVPWRALQIGLGSAALILIVATIWAWRMRG